MMLGGSWLRKDVLAATDVAAQKTTPAAATSTDSPRGTSSTSLTGSAWASRRAGGSTAGQSGTPRDWSGRPRVTEDLGSGTPCGRR